MKAEEAAKAQEEEEEEEEEKSLSSCPNIRGTRNAEVELINFRVFEVKN